MIIKVIPSIINLGTEIKGNNYIRTNIHFGDDYFKY